VNYCQVSDINAVAPTQDLVDLTDDLNTGQMNQTLITQYISDASEVIDDYLRGRYTLPFTAPAPGILLQICRSIALYNLYGRRIRLNPPEAIKAASDRAYKLLDKIQSGEIVLGVADAAPDTPNSGAIRYSEEHHTFTKCRLRDYSRTSDGGLEDYFGPVPE
jgi:phage gp36-like protein